MTAKDDTENTKESNAVSVESAALFGMLRPFPAPTGEEILFWNGRGWFVGEWDGSQFKEDGSGWSCPVFGDDCGYILLPNDLADSPAQQK